MSYEPVFLKPPEVEDCVLTHTFGDRVENHAGMQMIGELAAGFPDHTFADVQKTVGAAAACAFSSARPNPPFHVRPGFHDEVVPLGAPELPDAGLLVLRGGVDALLGPGGADALLRESGAQPFDHQYYDANKRKVLNKRARLNNCYADAPQKADIPAGKGTVVAFREAPLLQQLRERLPLLLGERAKDLLAETNLYRELEKRETGIGFHGDGERTIVVGVRLGQRSKELPLLFQLHRGPRALREPQSITLEHGDIYVMSEKAVGRNWRTGQLHLRHGTGRKAVPKPVASQAPESSEAPERNEARKRARE